MFGETFESRLTPRRTDFIRWGIDVFLEDKRSDDQTLRVFLFNVNHDGFVSHP